MKILVIAAHPDLSGSRVNKALAHEANKHEDVQVRDLYREYPDWNIDAETERRWLLEHDRIIFQFPLFWYSCPPLLKKWFDEVLTYGWAFGPGGEHLKGKEFVAATTTGGPENEYHAGGSNLFTISEFLRPIQSTINKCNAVFLPVFVSYNPADAAIAGEAERYVSHIFNSTAALAQ